jgi:hypothetical protein
MFVDHYAPPGIRLNSSPPIEFDRAAADRIREIVLEELNKESDTWKRLIPLPNAEPVFIWFQRTTGKTAAIVMVVEGLAATITAMLQSGKSVECDNELVDSYEDGIEHVAERLRPCDLSMLAEIRQKAHRPLLSISYPDQSCADDWPITGCIYVIARAFFEHVGADDI